jgi:AAA15 family ATPase/GTPase
MTIEQSLKIKNYKCFANEKQGFESILPINIIIGKNNSGKSSLIDLIEFSTHFQLAWLKEGRFNQPAEVFFSKEITHELIEQVFDGGMSSIPGYKNDRAFGLSLVGKILSIKISIDGKVVENIDELGLRDANRYVSKLSQKSLSPLHEKKFYKINSERNIGIEVTNNNKPPKVHSDGTGITNLIRLILHERSYDPDWIRKDFLQELNSVINPDIEFNDIMARHDEVGNYEIYLNDKNSGLIPISKMGSGIKTVLQVMVNLILLPVKIDKTQIQNCVFAFEELENNLHPSMLRRLFKYIEQYAISNNCHFFITTHSNLVIDLFSSNSNSQILHIIKEKETSVIHPYLLKDAGRQIIMDLGFKASDILLSNGIIWVKGPSDTIYIELLLELFAKSKETSNKGVLNYSIQSLTTAVWKYAGFTDFDWSKVTDDVRNRIISLEKLNLNHLLVIDNDNNYEDKKPSKWEHFKNGNGQNKARLIHESLKFGNNDENLLINNYGEADDHLFFWVNDGTFETYLEHFIKTKGKEEFEKYFDTEHKRGFFEKKREGGNHTKSKVELAIEISKFCLENNCTIDDIAITGSSLRSKIEKLYNTIVYWN